MPYRRVTFAKDNFYHLFNRGNRKSKIFFSDRDYQRFLQKLKEYKNEYGVEIVCYSLLPNHFHLLARTLNDDGLPKMMRSLLSSHSHYLSVKHELQGHLFQGPFKAKHIGDESYFLQLSRYIHLQPIKEKILDIQFIQRGNKKTLETKFNQKIRDYPWGSYKEYLSPSAENLCSVSFLTNLTGGKAKYRRFVESKIHRDDITQLDALETFI